MRTFFPLLFLISCASSSTSAVFNLDGLNSKPNKVVSFRNSKIQKMNEARTNKALSLARKSCDSQKVVISNQYKKNGFSFIEFTCAQIP